MVDADTVRLGDDRFVGTGARWQVETVTPLVAGTRVEVVFRPESLELGSPETADSITAQVVSRHYVGEATYFHLRIEPDSTLIVRGDLDQADVDDRVSVAPSGSGPPPRAFRLGGEEPV